MAHLIIKNIGPIREAEFDLNKINVFMGPQSSGKSTLAKIITFCHWIEKNVCLLRDFDDICYNPQSYFENYYNLQQYISDDSSIIYRSELIKLSYNGRIIEIAEPKDDYYKTYKRPKVLYIPAERNIISTLPNWFSIKLPDNCLKTFMAEWGEARTIYSQERPLNISPLDFSYYYDSKSKSDYVSIPYNNKSEYISLLSSSSGIQSALPLFLLFKAYYKDRKLLNINSSNEDAVTLENVYRRYLHYSTVRQYSSEVPLPVSEQFRYKGQYCSVKPGEKERTIQILDNFTENQYVQGAIEEPELNLFPKAQRKLIYEMIENIVENESQLTITTHSPYILFALNNCMMGGLVSENIPEGQKKEFPSRQAWIHPKYVSIYEICSGKIKRIQDEDGIITDNYLNQAYKDNSEEYLSLLNYYNDEE